MNKYTPKMVTGEFTLADGVEICKLIEPIAELNGFHVALTGGCLYGEGGRKDIDIVFYKIRDFNQPYTKNIMLATLAAEYGIKLNVDYGFVKKLYTNSGIQIDAMFPDHRDNSYTKKLSTKI